MKFLNIISILGLFAVATSTPLDSCTAQSECLKVIHNPCDPDGNRLICMGWTNKPECKKGPGDHISHACPADTGDKDIDGDGIEALYAGEYICQTVPAGIDAVFGIKDGSTCNDNDGGNPFALDGGIGGSICDGPGNYCQGGNTKECGWHIKTDFCDVDDPSPPIPPPPPPPKIQHSECSVYPDPHFRSFDSKFFDYHGECDLKLLYDPEDDFNVVIRTEQPYNTYSLIKSVYVGDSSGAGLQFYSDGSFYLGPGLLGALPLTFTSTTGIFAVSHTSTPGGYTALLTLLNHPGSNFIKIQLWGNNFRVNIGSEYSWMGDKGGLCGPFNGNNGDDFTNPLGVVLANNNLFGKSWISTDGVFAVGNHQDKCTPSGLPNINPRELLDERKICKKAGVPNHLLNDCAFDVHVLDDPDAVNNPQYNDPQCDTNTLECDTVGGYCEVDCLAGHDCDDTLCGGCTCNIPLLCHQDTICVKKGGDCVETCTEEEFNTRCDTKSCSTDGTCECEAQCGLGDVFCPGVSNIDDDGMITLLFEYSGHFNTLAMTLDDCYSGIWDVDPLAPDPVPTPWGTWTFGDLDGCRTISLFISIDDANTHCGFDILSEDNDSTTLRGDVYVETTSLEVDGRGESYTREESRGFIQDIILENDVCVVDNVLIYGPRINTPKINSKIYDPDDECVTITFTTRVQYPYKLINPVLDIPLGWQDDTTISPESDGECVMNAGNPAYPAEICEQVWVVYACRDVDCDDATGLQLNLDADWKVHYGVTCVDTFRHDTPGGCFVPEPNTDSVSFSTSSDNYCPRLLDIVPISGTLESYRDAARTELTDEFVFGAPTFFRGTINSHACITHAHAECVEIVSGGAIPNQKVFTDTLVDVPSFFADHTTGDWSVEMSDPDVESLLVNHNAHFPDCHTMIIDFSWIWSEVNSEATGDVPSPAQVKLCSRIRYEELDDNPLPRRRNLLSSDSSPKYNTQRVILQTNNLPSNKAVVREKITSSEVNIRNPLKQNSATKDKTVGMFGVSVLLSLSYCLF